jgi:hypothetical protein
MKVLCVNLAHDCSSGKLLYQFLWTLWLKKTRKILNEIHNSNMALNQLTVKLRYFYFVSIFSEYQIEFNPIYIQNRRKHNF